MLDPVLEKAFVKSGKGWKISLSDKDVDYCDTFQLLMTSKLANPHFTPEVSARVTIVDFTVTVKGLEDQLLGRVIQKEKAELQEQRQQLMEEVNSYKKKIKALEDDLLARLSESSGNLLDDTSLVDMLAITKQTAHEVHEKLLNANETERRIVDACEEFRPVATRGSVIYFLITEMSGVNCMYQTSLQQFLGLFELSITNAAKEGGHQLQRSKRINNIIDVLTFSTFLYMCRGFFESHKMLYALLLSLKIQMQKGILTQAHFDCFLKGGAALDISSVRRKPKEWISDMTWLHVIQLTASIPVFRDLADSMYRNDSVWKQWYDQEAPETTKVPEFDDRLDSFGRLLIVRALREDRTLLCASEFISDVLGRKYIESVPLNLETALAESDARTPLVCLLSPGSDPTNLIEALAKKRKKECKSVSMGQGQEIIAQRCAPLQSLYPTGHVHVERLVQCSSDLV